AWRKTTMSNCAARDIATIPRTVPPAGTGDGLTVIVSATGSRKDRGGCEKQPPPPRAIAAGLIPQHKTRAHPSAQSSRRPNKMGLLSPLVPLGTTYLSGHTQARGASTGLGCRRDDAQRRVSRKAGTAASTTRRPARPAQNAH